MSSKNSLSFLWAFLSCFLLKDDVFVIIISDSIRLGHFYKVYSVLDEIQLLSYSKMLQYLIQNAIFKYLINNFLIKRQLKLSRSQYSDLSSWFCCKKIRRSLVDCSGYSHFRCSLRNRPYAVDRSCRLHHLSLGCCKNVSS